MAYTSTPARSRAIAVETLVAVHAGRSLDDALPHDADPFARALTYGVLRHRRRLEAQLEPLMQRPPQPGTPLQALLLCGLYQLLEMDTADHAALNETVNACALLDLSGVRGLINAVLRRVQRERQAVIDAVPADPGVRHSYPPWLVRAIEADWGANSDAVLAAGNVQGPMTLRVNRRQQTLEAASAALAAAGHPARPVPGLPDALRLEQPCDVRQLPGFDTGALSVQDASAQLAVELLDLMPGQRVLDACAAPGGKAAHALERADVSIVALDHDPARLGKMQHGLRRLGLHAELLLSDAADVRRWSDGKGFDRILIDAPCSGTGVIRRHPDIKWLRRDTDLKAFGDTQARLLRRLWPLLKPDGVLVYATCSILRAEGDDIVRAFLMETPDGRPAAIASPVGHAERCGLRIAPGDDHDGFYYAKLVKKGSQRTVKKPR